MSIILHPDLTYYDIMAFRESYMVLTLNRWGGLKKLEQLKMRKVTRRMQQLGLTSLQANQRYLKME